MKYLFSLLILITTVISYSQDTTKFERYAGKYIYLHHKNGNKTEGRLLEISKDSLGILIEKKGMNYFSKSDIAFISESSKIGSGHNSKDEVYATRYFTVPNYLRMEKGDNYGKISLFGPEIQYAISKRWTLGMMMTWLGSPMGFTGKFSFPVSKKIHLGMGGMLGWGGILLPSGFTAIPFAGITFGNARANISFSGGYGVAGFLDAYQNSQTGEQPVFSMAAMKKTNDGATLVLESMFITSYAGNSSFNMIITPGLRFHRKYTRSIQMGLSLLVIDGKFQTYPIPSISWLFKAF